MKDVGEGRKYSRCGPLCPMLSLRTEKKKIGGKRTWDLIQKSDHILLHAASASVCLYFPEVFEGKRPITLGYPVWISQLLNSSCLVTLGKPKSPELDIFFPFIANEELNVARRIS